MQAEHPTSEIPQRIGVDIDGVLSNFVSPFCELIQQMFGHEVSTEPTHWNWYRDYGVTDVEDKQLWQWITHNPDWWGGIPALPYARMGIAHLRESGCEIYFITNRPGFGAKTVTENWLRHHGFPDPTVLVASDKAPIIRALKIDAFIDDKPETCVDVANKTSARVFMPDRSYNQNQDGWPESMGAITRVAELVDALAILWGRGTDAAAA
jgi:uncharacterized HAD superfamily protein